VFNTHFSDYFYNPGKDRYDLCRQHRFIIHSFEDEKNLVIWRLKERGRRLKEIV
jgi:hypothetical protein